MGEIRVLVVDDSSFARELISAVLSSAEGITVAGEAANGREAVRKVAELQPDIVTMDIEMPVMGGLEAIEEIMATNAVPILVVTTKADAGTAYAAISKGALDLVVKPDINGEEARELIAKVRMLAGIKVITHLRSRRPGAEPAEPRGNPQPVFSGREKERVVAIASSTGGPQALSTILSSLPENLPCPIVVAQHISDGFVAGMVEWLQNIARMKVKVAAAGEPLVAGTVYVSPSEKQMEIGRDRSIELTERLPGDIYRPSCDMLLSSAARVYGRNVIGVILTGMGRDGAKGMRSIKEAKGVCIAQDENSSVVYGMNKVAVDSGCIDKILPLSGISGEIIDRVQVVK
jgi:two-component system chemotaxis response regulator CheB